MGQIRMVRRTSSGNALEATVERLTQQNATLRQQVAEQQQVIRRQLARITWLEERARLLREMASEALESRGGE